MSESLLLSLVAALFAMLTGILAWVGMRIFEKLDHLGDQIADGNGELHDRITALDRRVTTVEATCQIIHGMKKSQP